MSEAPFAIYRDLPLARPALSHLRYLVKRPFSFFARRMEVYTADGRKVMHVSRPVFRLREELVLYGDDGEAQPLVRLEMRSVFELSRLWDVSCAVTGQRLGSLRKQFVQSLVRDTWDILDVDEVPIGQLIETGPSFLRRVLSFLTSRHEIRLVDGVAARIRQIFRFFHKEFELDLSPALGKLDTRFALACALLVLMSETRRETL